MSLMKRMERELNRDWQALQLEQIPALKTAALKAYYIKFRLYQKSRAWSLRLQDPTI